MFLFVYDRYVSRHTYVEDPSVGSIRYNSLEVKVINKLFYVFTTRDSTGSFEFFPTTCDKLDQTSHRTRLPVGRQVLDGTVSLHRIPGLQLSVTKRIPGTCLGERFTN